MAVNQNGLAKSILPKKSGDNKKKKSINKLIEYHSLFLNQKYKII